MPAVAAAPTSSAPTAVIAAPGPRVVEIASGSVTMPEGASASSGTVPPPDPAAATPAPDSAMDAPAPVQARKGAALLGRALGLMPLAAGLTQIVLGLMITRGTLSLAAVPVLGALPKFLVGGLVASTAMPSVASGVMKLLGKEPLPPPAGSR